MLLIHIRLLMHICIHYIFTPSPFLIERLKLWPLLIGHLHVLKTKNAIEIEIKYETNCKHVKLSISGAPNLK